MVGGETPRVTNFNYGGSSVTGTNGFYQAVLVSLP